MTPSTLALAGVILCLTVSANLLTWIGIPYVTEGGALALKIHPGNLLIACAAALSLLRPRKAGPHPAIVVFLCAMAFSIADAVATTGPGIVIVFLDTFLPAGLLAVAWRDLNDTQRGRVLAVIELALACNALLALAEAATQSHWIPLYLDGAEARVDEADFRPSALYDHPLTGAALTMIGMLLPPRPGAGRLPRSAYLLLLAASAIVFGGRTSIALTLLILAWRVARATGHAMLRREAPALPLVPTLAIGLLAAGAVPLALWLGQTSRFGERLTGHLYWDSSAQIRVAQWHVLAMLDPSQILFGCRRADLLALLVPLHLASGVEVIENFWLLMFIGLGVLGFPVFAAGMASLLAWSAREAGPRGATLVLATIAAASSSNSLGRKSSLLVVLVAASIAARPPRPHPDQELP